MKSSINLSTSIEGTKKYGVLGVAPRMTPVYRNFD